MSALKAIPVDVIVEAGPKRRVFARAMEWPGWCHSGRDEAAALTALASCRQRYAEITERAMLGTPRGALNVKERLRGTEVTDFGAIASVARAELLPFTQDELDRSILVLAAAWNAFAVAFTMVPSSKRAVKPQRSRSAVEMLHHVLETDAMHLAGVSSESFRKPQEGSGLSDLDTLHAKLRDALARVELGAQAEPVQRYGFTWTPRFAIQRSAWHAIDHAWELTDR